MKRSLLANSLIVGLFMMTWSACVDKSDHTPAKTDAQIHEEMIEFNKNSAVLEEQVIKHYLREHNTDMARTGTGLWYKIYKKGTGDSLVDGRNLTVDFKVYMINDSLCYSSDDTGAFTFRLGMSDVESGIHEGVRYLREGGEARFIMPSHLAHGLMGDMKKIPPKTPVIYDVHILKVE